MFEFINGSGDFSVKNPELNSFMYFPLANESGMMSCVSPTLNGDIKSEQNVFAATPVSSIDLQNSKSGRNFWIYVDGKGAWSAVGSSAKQQADIFSGKKEETELKAGFLWHTVCRKSGEFGIMAEVTTFVPVINKKLELTKVTLKNIGDSPVTFTPTVAIPLFGRSADNLRDHRHVTSLLHRIRTTDYGVTVKPTLSFDERGHKENNISYGVFSTDNKNSAPVGFFPVSEEFFGEGGSFENPYAVVKNISPEIKSGAYIEGYEAVGAIRFKNTTLLAGEKAEYVIAIQIIDNDEQFISEYVSVDDFDKYLNENKIYWENKLRLKFGTNDEQFDLWMRWVTFQPIMRRIFGCSFLPHHDYGRGGRGWRDLWQDCLALLLIEPSNVREMLLNNYAGVRFDGTNATIIGTKPGEFIADRNNIARVWMDHGAWPFVTTKLYIDQSADLEFLLEKQTYFKDKQVYRGKQADDKWDSEQGSKLTDEQGGIYEGTILEHILVQHLTAFFNVGAHNNMKLDGADWNDAFDMAAEKGESVAFTALYCSNLREIAELLKALNERKNINTITLAKEITALVEANAHEYDSVKYKHNILDSYYETCRHNIAGETRTIDINTLVNDLTAKYDWLSNHISKSEFIKNSEGFEWFNGYYDNDGEKVEGDFPTGVRMTLTGQVFNVMGGVATDEQVRKATAAADRYLFDERIGGYRLNTNFKELKKNLGRCFGYAYGHKENGSVFSHMTTMYANALYRRGFVNHGFKAIDTLYKHCCNSDKAKMYPGLPEYVNEKGRGVYSYLTGSASWFILTMLTEVFGIKGSLGDLKLEPKLMPTHFKSGEAHASTIFANKPIKVIYENNKNLAYENYIISEIEVNGKKDFNLYGKHGTIERKYLDSLPSNKETTIRVKLS